MVTIGYLGNSSCDSTEKLRMKRHARRANILLVYGLTLICAVYFMIGPLMVMRLASETPAIIGNYLLRIKKRNGMKIIPEQYRCEVCGFTYDSVDAAITCESRKPPQYPVGLMYGCHGDGDIYDNMTFAVAEVVISGHRNVSGSWACRNTGDYLFDTHCRGYSLNLNASHGRLNPDHPTFLRMVEYLKQQNIPVTVWNGHEAVALEQYKADYYSKENYNDSESI
jgi:hypothetical protein